METPAENPTFTERLQALRDSLPADAGEFVRQSLDQLSQAATLGTDAVRTQLDIIRQSVDFTSLSQSVRDQFDALQTSIDTGVEQMQQQATSIPGQVASAIGQGFESMPWYVKYPAVIAGVHFVRRGVSGLWKWITSTASSAKKMAIVAGASILAGIGIKSVYDGSRGEKPTTV